MSSNNISNPITFAYAVIVDRKDGTQEDIQSTTVSYQRSSPFNDIIDIRKKYCDICHWLMVPNFQTFLKYKPRDLVSPDRLVVECPMHSTFDPDVSVIFAP
jgi:hypothetical protein